MSVSRRGFLGRAAAVSAGVAALGGKAGSTSGRPLALPTGRAGCATVVWTAAGASRRGGLGGPNVRAYCSYEAPVRLVVNGCRGGGGVGAHRGLGRGRGAPAGVLGDDPVH